MQSSELLKPDHGIDILTTPLKDNNIADNLNYNMSIATPIYNNETP